MSDQSDRIDQGATAPPPGHLVSRALLQRVSLWLFGTALVIALLCGLLAIFGASNSLGPLIGTALITMMLGGVTYGGLRQFDRPDGEVPGLVTVGMGLIVWCFLVLSFWSDQIDSLPRRAEEALAFSGMVVLAYWLPIYIGTLSWRTEVGRRCGKVLLFVWGFGVVATVLMLWIEIGEWWMNWYITPLLIAGTAIALLLLRTAMWRWASWMGITAAGCGALLWMSLDTQAVNFSNDHLHTTALVSCFTLAWSLAIPNALSVIAPGRMPMLRIATMACAVISLMTIGMAAEFELARRTHMDIEVLARVASGFGMLMITGGLGLAMTRRMNKSFLEQPHGIALELRCPRCRLHMELDQGASMCPRCGLKFRVTFEAPNCRACDYNLSPNYPERCPECGTLVVLPDEAGLETQATPCCDSVATAPAESA